MIAVAAPLDRRLIAVGQAVTRFQRLGAYRIFRQLEGKLAASKNVIEIHIWRQKGKRGREQSFSCGRLR